MDDDGVDVVGYLVDGEEGVYHYLGLVLLVPLLQHVVLEPVDGDDEVVGELGDKVVLDGLDRVLVTSSPFL